MPTMCLNHPDAALGLGHFPDGRGGPGATSVERVVESVRRRAAACVLCLLLCAKPRAKRVRVANRGSRLEHRALGTILELGELIGKELLRKVPGLPRRSL